MLSVLSFGPVALLALFYLLRWGWREWPRICPLLLFIGYLTAVHMVTVGSVRYRLPIEPFLIVLAAPVFRRILGFVGGLFGDRTTGRTAPSHDADSRLGPVTSVSERVAITG